MERRVLLAVFLSFLVLYAYQGLVVPPPVVAPETPAGSAAEVPPPAPDVQTPPTDRTADPLPRQPETIRPVDPPTPQPVIADEAPRDIVVDSDHVRAVFSNRGGELVSWELKQYLEDGTPVQLIPPDLPIDEPWPFSLLFEDEALTDLAHAGLYRPSVSRLQLRDRPETITFEYEDGSGLLVRKRFAFDPGVNPYQVTLSLTASLHGQPLAPIVRWGPALGGVQPSSGGFGFAGVGGVGSRGLLYGRVLEEGVLGDPGIERIAPASVVGQPRWEGQLAFAGVDNLYFATIAVPPVPGGAIAFRTVNVPPVTPEASPLDLVAFDLTLAEGTTQIPFFVGPKDFDILEATTPVLVRAIDFGWLSWLVVPLHRSLKWIHGFVGNWGWAIVLLTFGINLVIFPLRHKSVVSMRKMQEIQPEMKAIQDRYKNLKTTDPDKQKMNQEVMALYRERGVNPASGCLPMLLTMPILFAFYRLLGAAIELRGAPFMLWIQDLSIPDPFYVTPIVMGASMVLQQRMTPSQADPTQQKIMMIMPVVFTFMFLGFPSGLVLYWMTSNLLGITQQVITNKISGPPKVRTVRPPAEGKAKSKKTVKGNGAKRRG